MMVRLRQCCCGCSLKEGTIVIAVICIVSRMTVSLHERGYCYGHTDDCHNTEQQQSTAACKAQCFMYCSTMCFSIRSNSESCVPNVHQFLGKWFLVNDQRDAQILFYIFISIYNSLHVSSTSCSSSGETNCINSGNRHSRLVAEMCADWKIILPTCTHLGHQHRMIIIRGCINTICLSWWWARCARNM